MKEITKEIETFKKQLNLLEYHDLEQKIQKSKEKIQILNTNLRNVREFN